MGMSGDARDYSRGHCEGPSLAPPAEISAAARQPPARKGGSRMGFLDELKKMTRPYDDDDEFFDDEDEAIPVAEEPAPARPAQARPAQARPAAARRPAPAPKKGAPSCTTSRRNRSVPRRAMRREATAARPTRSSISTTAAASSRSWSLRRSSLRPRPRSRSICAIAAPCSSTWKKTDPAVARRLIDFLSGVAYAQDGKIRRVASATYIITPFNVDLMGDQLDDMESGEFHL